MFKYHYFLFHIYDFACVVLFSMSNSFIAIYKLHSFEYNLYGKESSVHTSIGGILLDQNQRQPYIGLLKPERAKYKKLT